MMERFRNILGRQRRRWGLLALVLTLVVTAAAGALFSLLLVGVMSGLVQVVAFSGLLIKKLAYGWRMVLFFVVFGAILTAFAVGFGWFPVENAWAWVSFGVAFLLIFAAIAGGIEIYYRASGRRWDDRLDWYRRNRDKK